MILPTYRVETNHLSALVCMLVSGRRWVGLDVVMVGLPGASTSSCYAVGILGPVPF